MKKLYAIVSSLIILSTLMVSCKDKTDDLTLPSLQTYYPTTIGKFVTYKVDSTLFINFGTQKVVRSGFHRDVIEANTNDAQGRPSVRVSRYFKRNLSDPQWQNQYTFLATIYDNGNTFEFVENNYRFIKLKNPVRNDFKWRGNTYIIENNSFTSDLDYLLNWNYTYKNVNQNYTVNGVVVPNTITVEQANNYSGDSTNALSVYEVNKSVEVYAKGIGLIYKDFLHLDYLPPNPPMPPSTVVGPGKFKDNSYGIRLTMIDHN
jgi:hypothetical protein